MLAHVIMNCVFTYEMIAMSEEAYLVELEEEPIELCNLLKVLTLVESGGQAKMLIAEGYVGLNNEICVQKRKKVYSGDVIAFDGEFYQLTLAEGVTPVERPIEPPSPIKPQADTTQTKKAANKKAKNKKSNKDSKTGRRPISFG